jgi:DNA replication and repair protein RecF
VAASRRIHLTRLKLTDFRNFSTLKLETGPQHVVLTGENGAGKTNLLEAVSFLSPGRGLRRATYETVARHGGPGTWSVHAEILSADGPVEIGTGLSASHLGIDTQRQIRINAAKARSSDELLDHLRVVWLTPAMDGLFTGPASDRRRFLDRLVLAIDPAHGRRVSDFEKSMRARNRLLGEDSPDSAWLDAIENQMSEAGIAIALARMELVSLLAGVIIGSSDPASPFPDAHLALDGVLDAVVADGAAAADMENEYRDRLASQRRLDAAAGRTLEGPHRSDFRVTHRPKSMPAENCSTGEQKALLIGIVLAHAQLVKELRGHAPVMLLDEIAAHLDAGRRAALFDRMDELDCQAWMTGTDRALFDSLGARAQYFTVDSGALSKD